MTQDFAPRTSPPAWLAWLASLPLFNSVWKLLGWAAVLLWLAIDVVRTDPATWQRGSRWAGVINALLSGLHAVGGKALIVGLLLLIVLALVVAASRLGHSNDG
jgi:hypothetical protein